MSVHIQRWAAALLASLLFTSSLVADPLHPFRTDDPSWHHGSGWIYPRLVSGFRLHDSPQQLDGNDDVTAKYSLDANGALRTAVVDVYVPGSAAVGANFETAKAFVQSRVNQDDCKTAQSE